MASLAAEWQIAWEDGIVVEMGQRVIVVPRAVVNSSVVLHLQIGKVLVVQRMLAASALVQPSHPAVVVEVMFVATVAREEGVGRMELGHLHQMVIASMEEEQTMLVYSLH